MDRDIVCKTRMVFATLGYYPKDKDTVCWTEYYFIGERRIIVFRIVKYLYIRDIVRKTRIFSEVEGCGLKNKVLYP